MKWWIAVGILAMFSLVVGGIYFFVSTKNTSISKTIEEVVPQGESAYTKRFVGELVSMDKTNATMTLISSDGSSYNFAISQAMIENNDADLMVPTGSKIEVMWKDAVSMDEIMMRYEKDPNEVVNKGNTAISITQVQ